MVFENLNLTVAPGEKVLITGENGCGKTTLLKLISGLLPLDTGKIIIGETGTPYSSRNRLGLMLSFEMLYPSLSGWENLEFASRLHRIPRREEAIQRVAAQWKFETHLDAIAQTYSYGLKARLCAARATIHNPNLILMDEPTVTLDKIGCDILIDFLAQTDATVIVATHQPELFKNVTDRCINLNSHLGTTQTTEG